LSEIESTVDSGQILNCFIFSLNYDSKLKLKVKKGYRYHARKKVQTFNGEECFIVSVRNRKIIVVILWHRHLHSHQIIHKIRNDLTLKLFTPVISRQANSEHLCYRTSEKLAFEHRQIIYLNFFLSPVSFISLPVSPIWYNSKYISFSRKI
jgi:hypothetical protein